MVLPGVDGAEALAVAARLGGRATRASVSISIGAATFPDDTSDVALIQRLADENLYAAKRAGRGRAHVGRDRHTTF
jgi:GGDEF domain-containing protein